LSSNERNPFTQDFPHTEEQCDSATPMGQSHQDCAISSAVERALHTGEVTGSIPVSRTIPDLLIWERQKFHRSVKRAGPDDCWEWQGARSHGYGRLRLRRRLFLAHRVAYTLAKGPIPPGAVVMHACDNPPCCNPAHLSLGTMLDNARDMDAKGRGRRIGPKPRLTPDTIRLICESNLSQRKTADAFGVSRIYVRQLWAKHGR
jgi:hypothetical protein